jgi:hypothetical protein
VTPRIVNLTIESFRSFRELKLERLGRVNLITGRNNTGKSSVLEALRILASDSIPFTLYSILTDREEYFSEVDDSARQADNDAAMQLSTLFHGFPLSTEDWRPIVISSNGGQRPMKVSLKLGWFSEERSADGSRTYIPQQSDLFDEEGRVLAIVSATGDSERIFPFGYLRRYGYRPRALRPDYGNAPPISCIYVSAYGGESTAAFGALWDKIALSDHEASVVDALRIIDPSISAVSMVGGQGVRGPRTAIVRSSRIPRPVPLRSFGDGLNRLFGIALSLVNANDGLLLIDEFENGMHFSVQLDTWRMIFKLAASLGVQVFATSHSWDAIDAFQKAAAETPEEGVLVRLARKGEDIVPTIFREDELRVATRDGIEVR